MGAVLNRFEGHDGPVRGLDIHPTQNMFVSCGDDAAIRVWSLQSKKLLFTLTGHFDYVRTAFFHPDLPWIVSASDDQTIRIWNWQNRQEIACLTGHNHWITCAQFHPTEDLIVSSSLDQTIRVWDISGLRRRHSAPTQPGMGGFEEYPRPSSMMDSDGFGVRDIEVKWILTGHDRGVTWVAFHPTESLLVSSSEDRTVRVWRMVDSRALQIDVFRGHTDDVVGAEFHPWHDLVLSVSSDKTLRVWDLGKHQLLHTFKRASDKFWSVKSHPAINLLVAAHDSGVLVFKLERERPAFVLQPTSSGAAASMIYITPKKLVKEFDPKNPVDKPALLSLSSFGTPSMPIREVSYTPAERAIIVTAAVEGGKCGYLMAKLPSQSLGPVEPSTQLTGVADQAIFYTRNRFAILLRDEKRIETRDLQNAVVKSIKPPIVTEHIAPGPSGQLLLLGAKSVVLFDVQKGEIVAKLAVSKVKYAAWSHDDQYVALQSKHMITIADARLNKISSLHETIRLKSVGWDEQNIVIYTTFNHLKYALLNGDNGVLKTLSSTLYVTQVRGTTVYGLNRQAEVLRVVIDPTEYRFKRALVNKQFGEVARIIRTSQLVGQSIVAYLQKAGYPEIALQFVQDPQTKFDLAVECGDLNVAVEQARLLNKPVADMILASEAMSQGNHDIVEDVCQKQGDLERLAFLYLITGNKSRLQKLEQIADHRNDLAGRFQTSLFLNNVETRVQLLRDAGQPALAFALAKSQGLASLAGEIAGEAGVDIDEIDVPINNVANDLVLGVSHETFKSQWPLKPRVDAHSILEAINAAATDVTEQLENLDVEAGGISEIAESEPESEGGWDVDVEVGDEAHALPVVEPEHERWIRNSFVPADHVAAGSFETAAQLLNRQVGVVNFAPLKRRFMDIYRACTVYMKTHDGLPPLAFYIKRSSLLPQIPNFDTVSLQLQEAYKQVKANKIDLAVETFREVLYTVLLLAVSSEKEEQECKKIIEICRNYILAFTIELKRRALPASETKRNLELAAYFTRPVLRPAHAALQYQVALRSAYEANNYGLASYFASQSLKLMKPGPSADRVRKIQAKCDAHPLDEIDIEFDRFASFEICPSTLTPIYEGQPRERDNLTGAVYHASEKGKLCTITQITQIGAPASGLRLYQPLT